MWRRTKEETAWHSLRVRRRRKIRNSMYHSSLAASLSCWHWRRCRYRFISSGSALISLLDVVLKIGLDLLLHCAMYLQVH